MTQPYYNTLGITGQELKKEVAKATKQEQAAFAIFFHTRQPLTVSDVLKLCEKAGHNWIKVSIGRAVTNLFNNGDLIKVPDRKKGLYNATEGYYQLNPKKHPAPTNVKQSSLFQ